MKSTARIGCATKASSLWGGAGPGPYFGFGGQVSGDWVALDVSSNAIEFDGSADPVVERFILPKGFAGAAEDGICFASGDAFEAIHEARYGNMRRDQQMDVVGHDDKSV